MRRLLPLVALVLVGCQSALPDQIGEGDPPLLENNPGPIVCVRGESSEGGGEFCVERATGVDIECGPILPTDVCKEAAQAALDQVRRDNPLETVVRLEMRDNVFSYKADFASGRGVVVWGD